MFISTLVGSKKLAKVHSIIGSMPKQVRDELDDVVIIYRGIVSTSGSYGDLLVRKKGHRICNIVWNEGYGEVREMDPLMLDKLVKFYDMFVQEMLVREPRKMLDKVDIINQKIDISPATAFKKASKQ
ncbi:MAG: hypothetical protein N3G76_00405 [Candidatus Micrarchaeota archaeon]|nr:hypothetical protein [Candidatus Micrarchaeota archaeon]